MKKIICLLSLSLFLLASCTNPFMEIRLTGVFESETSNVKVVLIDGTSHFLGELEENDGTKMNILLIATRGGFAIYEISETGTYGGDYIYHGKFKQKKDALILITEEAGEIVLERKSDVPEGYIDTVSYPERQ